MALKIAGQLFADLKIDGKDAPTSGAGFYEEICIYESLDRVAPFCTLRLTDASRTLEKKLQLVDGTRLSLKVGDSEDSTEEYEEFTVYGTGQRQPQGEGHLYLVTALLNVPKWYGSCQRRSLDGTSHAVVKQLAEDSGLQFEGHETSDQQIWLALQKTAARIALDVSRAGRISDSSAMVLAVTARRQVLYYDLMRRATQEPTATLAHSPREGEFRIVQESYSSQSGTGNNLVNYGYIQVTRGTEGSNTLYQQVAAPTREGSLPIDGRTQQQVALRRLHFSEPDQNNCHRQYQQARHQNARIRTLFSERLSVMVHQCTGLRLLDTVEYRGTEAYSGTWVLAAKTRTVRHGQFYGERLELIRHQVSAKMEAPKEAAPDPNTSSMQPDADIDQPLEVADAATILRQTEAHADSLNSLLDGLGVTATQLGSLLEAIGQISPRPTASGLLRLARAQTPALNPDLTGLRALQVLRSPRALTEIAGRWGSPLSQVQGFASRCRSLSHGAVGLQDVIDMGCSLGIDLDPARTQARLGQLTGKNPALASLRSLLNSGYGPLSDATGGRLGPAFRRSLACATQATDLRHLQKMVPAAQAPALWQAQERWFENWAAGHGLQARLARTPLRDIPSLRANLLAGYVPLVAVPAVLQEAAVTPPQDLYAKVRPWGIVAEGRHLKAAQDALQRIGEAFYKGGEKPHERS